MKIFLKLLGFTAIFLFSFLKSEAKGRDVVIFLKDSTEVRGELLAVRDSLVAIAVEPINADEDIAAFPERVKIVKFQNIDTIIIGEVSRYLSSTLIAAGSTAVFGFVIDQAGGIFKKGDFPVALSTIFGGIVGLGVGYVISDNEEQFIFLENKMMKIVKDSYRGKASFQTVNSLLKKHSRFKESEPSYLRDIIDNLLQETK